MASTLNCLLGLTIALAVFAASAEAFAPRAFAFSGRRDETRQAMPLDCSPRSDGTTPHGCADTVAGNAINYEAPGEKGVLEFVEGLDDSVRVVEDERAGTFVIRVPRYQPLHRRGCPYRHVFVAELGICVRDSNLRRLSLRYPGLATRLL